eukprot:comp24294_c0_seq1/m.45520 comp24294_c0_seq1/g.45520  ORF comp24294_c0_seq1/g.45520 comp24294_c0_seq1/m.45520 type:complete len:170 (-) comp24294_c0_seq1:86-595(-)
MYYGPRRPKAPEALPRDLAHGKPRWFLHRTGQIKRYLMFDNFHFNPAQGRQHKHTRSEATNRSRCDAYNARLCKQLKRQHQYNTVSHEIWNSLAERRKATVRYPDPYVFYLANVYLDYCTNKKLVAAQRESMQKCALDGEIVVRGPDHCWAFACAKCETIGHRAEQCPA